ncbi:amino acid ABC transporter permease [Streptomyces sp. NPDC090026]|uniref:amino acid ABC transporter permease n=1 Tax=Streptomyces sp. NPDC090026 TaxID=3365923 RepID=UPI0038056188
MAWEEEWAQLKSDARMRLAGAGDEVGAGSSGSGGTGSLKHVKKQWNDAAGVAGDLRTSMNTAMGKLGEGHDGVKNMYELEHYGVSTGTNGVDSFDTLRGVLESWEKRLEAIRDECEALEPALRKTGQELTGTDVKVRTSMESVKVDAVTEGR